MNQAMKKFNFDDIKMEAKIFSSDEDDEMEQDNTAALVQFPTEETKVGAEQALCGPELNLIQIPLP